MVVILMLISLGSFYIASTHQNDVEAYQVEGLPIQHQFLTINPYSRSGKSLHRVNGIVIHYTANPGSTAKNNRNYFENLRYTKTTSVSSHFIIGLDGEIIQCIPLNEIAYASIIVIEIRFLLNAVTLMKVENSMKKHITLLLNLSVH